MPTSANRFVHRTNVIDRLGRTVVYAGELLRHPVYTRFLHWMVGIFFFLALLSGFGIYLPWIFRFFTPLFGGGATTRCSGAEPRPAFCIPGSAWLSFSS